MRNIKSNLHSLRVNFYFILFLTPIGKTIGSSMFVEEAEAQCPALVPACSTSSSITECFRPFSLKQLKWSGGLSWGCCSVKVFMWNRPLSHRSTPAPAPTQPLDPRISGECARHEHKISNTPTPPRRVKFFNVVTQETLPAEGNKTPIRVTHVRGQYLKWPSHSKRPSLPSLITLLKRSDDGGWCWSPKYIIWTKQCLFHCRLGGGLGWELELWPKPFHSHWIGFNWILLTFIRENTLRNM